MPGIVTSKQPWIYRPTGLVLPNPGSLQATGLTAWWTFQQRSDQMRGVAFTTAPALRLTTVGIGHDVGLRLSAPSSAVSLTVGTIALWTIPDFASSASGSYPYFFDTDSARHACYKHSIANRVDMYNDGRYTGFAATWAAGDLIHLAFAYNKTGNIQRVYLNGREANIVASGTGTWGSTALGTNCHWGNSSGNDAPWDGALLDGRCYHRVLSAAEIWGLYAPRTRWELYAPAPRITYLDLAAGTQSQAPRTYYYTQHVWS